MLRTIEWISESNTLRLLDQTRLPDTAAYLNCTEVQHAWDAIKRLSVRGAPAIGVAAAYGAYLAIAAVDAPVDELHSRLCAACDHLATSRPTAVNLFWALDRLRRVPPPCTQGGGQGDGRGSEAQSKAQRPQPSPFPPPGVPGGGQHDYKSAVLAECHAIRDEDIDCCRRIGTHGLSLFQSLAKPEPWRILTHCNAGALATSGIGTALAPIYLAHQAGIRVEVFADETRPLLQGARLTAYELRQAGIPVTVQCDGMAASLMSQGKIEAVIVGADRIAANGDTANKVGTLPLAIVARHYAVPFFVAAPTSTIDRALPDGRGIPIEHRAPDEIAHPNGVSVFNPAFDVTPRELIAAIVTENGVWRPNDLPTGAAAETPVPTDGGKPRV